MAPKPKSKTATKPKPAAKAAKPTKAVAKPNPPFRYEGSTAQKMDQALIAGGTWDKLAQKAGVLPGTIRSHAKFRAKSGKHRLEEKGDQTKLIPEA